MNFEPISRSIPAPPGLPESLTLPLVPRSNHPRFFGACQWNQVVSALDEGPSPQFAEGLAVHGSRVVGACY